MIGAPFFIYLARYRIGGADMTRVVARPAPAAIAALSVVGLSLMATTPFRRAN